MYNRFCNQITYETTHIQFSTMKQIIENYKSNNICIEFPSKADYYKRTFDDKDVLKLQ